MGIPWRGIPIRIRRMQSWNTIQNLRKTVRPAKNPRKSGRLYFLD
jgi:hypothetical protein